MAIKERVRPLLIWINKKIQKNVISVEIIGKTIKIEEKRWNFCDDGINEKIIEKRWKFYNLLNWNLDHLQSSADHDKIVFG